jgi:hypothetical protein
MAAMARYPGVHNRSERSVEAGYFLALTQDLHADIGSMKQDFEVNVRALRSEDPAVRTKAARATEFCLRCEVEHCIKDGASVRFHSGRCLEAFRLITSSSDPRELVLP